jgi:ubiquitin carboxyl-terminal hydrolase 4/11/15
MSVTVSSKDTLKTLCGLLATTVSLNPQAQTPYRVWKLELPIDDVKSLEYPCSRLFLEGGNIVEEIDKTIDEEYITSGDSFVVEFMQPDGWLVDDSHTLHKFPGFAKLLEVPQPQPLFSSNDGFFSRLGNSLPSSSSFKLNDELYSSFTNRVTKSSSNFSSASLNDHNARSRQPGILGLGNM